MASTGSLPRRKTSILPWGRIAVQGNVLSPLVVIRRPSDFLMQAWTPSTGNERVRFSPWRAPSPFQRAPLRKTLGVRRDCCKRMSIILHFGNGRRRGLRFPRACTLGIRVLATCQTPRQDFRADQFPLTATPSARQSRTSARIWILSNTKRAAASTRLSGGTASSGAR